MAFRSHAVADQEFAPEASSRPPSLVSTTSSASSTSLPLPPPPGLTAFPFPSASFPYQTETNLSCSSLKVAFPSSPAERPPSSIYGIRDVPTTPRHVLMRSRRISLPANLVQTNLHSIVSAVPPLPPLPPPSGSHASAKSERLSVASLASIGSFESLPEEEGNSSLADSWDDGRPRARARPLSTRAHTSLPPVAGSATAASIASRGEVRPGNPKRHSSPANRLLAFPTGNSGRSSGKTRAVSPLGRPQLTGAAVEHERAYRDERRSRIALELRDTERSYMAVLNEINKDYYEPLLGALPLSDLANRRRSKSASVPEAQSLALSSSPLMSSIAFASRYAPFSLAGAADSTAEPTSTVTSPDAAAPVLSRREVAEIFSNFSDVLRLAQVMLETIEKAVPDRDKSTKPVAVPGSRSSPSDGRLPRDSSVEPQLSYSASTASSTDSIDSPPPTSPPSLSPLLRSQSTSRRGLQGTAAAPPLDLGHVLLPVLPFLKAYSFFISNFASAITRLSVLENADYTHPWRKFCEGKRKRGLGLGDMLLSIVQRIPRYRFMLADLVRFTDRDHPDRKELIKAFDIVDGVATHLEAEITSHTNAHQLLDLQRRFTNLDAPLVAPGRRILRVGKIRKLDRRGNEQTRTLLLFNDILVHASSDASEVAARPVSVGSASSIADHSASQLGMYRFHRRFRLEDVTVVGGDDKVAGRFQFQILSPEKSFAVDAESLQAKIEWLEAIRDAKNQLLNDRRTLHRDAPQAEEGRPFRERRTSMPANSMLGVSAMLGGASAFLGGRSPGRQPSYPPPRLDFIPATPATEQPEPTLLPRSDSPSPVGSPQTTASPLPRPWSVEGYVELADLIAQSEIKEEPIVEEYHVIESYSAPVWVPDSKADRCMKCAEAFGVWRRRHHCRLCGSVVCWACSTKFFIIPSSVQDGPDRLARSCDECYANVFGNTARAPLSRAANALAAHLPPSALTSPNGSGVPTPLVYMATPPLATPGIGGTVEEKGSAAGQLASLLSR